MFFCCQHLSPRNAQQVFGLPEICPGLRGGFILCAPAHRRGRLSIFFPTFQSCSLQNAWTDGAVDSRNVATLEFVVAVTNIADTPPVFISAPPITRMPQTALPGDFVLALVAKDGDAGPGRPIRWNQNILKTTTTFAPRYKLDTRYSGAGEFFRLDPLSGRVTVRRALKELDSNQASAPILLRVVAQEVRNLHNWYYVTCENG